MMAICQPDIWVGVGEGSEGVGVEGWVGGCEWVILGGWPLYTPGGGEGGGFLLDDHPPPTHSHGGGGGIINCKSLFLLGENTDQLNGRV